MKLSDTTPMDEELKQLLRELIEQIKALNAHLAHPQDDEE